ncbi:MAG: hypothetical protein JWM27_4373 [Gemmatimonadetes bacterium]|nr:hypothetical protein [Gemmatimonadota bacterium]
MTPLLRRIALSLAAVAIVGAGCGWYWLRVWRWRSFAPIAREYLLAGARGDTARVTDLGSDDVADMIALQRGGSIAGAGMACLPGISTASGARTDSAHVSVTYRLPRDCGSRYQSFQVIYRNNGTGWRVFRLFTQPD